MRRGANMIELSGIGIACLVAVGFILAAAFVCALLARITAAQKGAIGCFVLACVFCCGLALLLLFTGLGIA